MCEGINFGGSNSKRRVCEELYIIERTAGIGYKRKNMKGFVGWIKATAVGDGNKKEEEKYLTFSILTVLKIYNTFFVFYT